GGGAASLPFHDSRCLDGRDRDYRRTARVRSSRNGRSSIAQRYPDLDVASAGHGIEVCAVALELRRVGGLQARGRQPALEDRGEGLVDAGDVPRVTEYRVTPRRQALTGEAWRQLADMID